MIKTSRLEVRVDIELPSLVVVDLSHFLVAINEGGVGVMRQSINPVSREMDLSLASLTFDNSDGRFMYDLPNSIIQKNAYSGLRVRTFFRWSNEDGTVSGPTLVSVGFIDYITWDVGASTAEFKLYDALNKVRVQEVQPDAVDVVLNASDTPANNILKALKVPYAGVPVAFIDVASFTAASSIESAAGILMAHYRLLAGSYYANVQEALKYGNATLTVGRDGRIKYYQWQPDVVAGSPTLSERENVLDFSGSESFSALRNTVRTARGNGANPPVLQAFAKRSTVSLPGLPERAAPDLPLIYFSTDAPRNLAADRRIELTSFPAGTYTATCHLDQTTALIETGQKVRVRVPRLGFNPKDLLVIEASFSVASSRATFVLYDTAIATLPWLYTNNSQQLDNDQLIY